MRRLEKGYTLAEIVITLKFEPKEVERIYNGWIRLSQKDANFPNLERLNQNLMSHLLKDHSELADLLLDAKNIGEFRRSHCEQVDRSGLCLFWTYEKRDGSEFHIEASALRCAFCINFHQKTI